MASANYPISTELISDYAGGRLDAEDVRVIEEAIDHDEAIATAVAAARKVDSRMTISLARRVAGHRTHALEAQAITGRQVGPVACISIGVR
jgi:anti-sigma factor RsiW